MVPEHEKLTVYRKAVDAAHHLDTLARAVPERRGDLRDQLLRASASIPLNIAEGASEFSPGEKAKYYRIARRSAAESMAVLDVLARIGIGIPSSSVDTRKEELVEIAAMLTVMVQRMSEKRS